eukprot:SAG31_NODE_41879_length_274_cov_0.588571_1_plen_41_part_01
MLEQSSQPMRLRNGCEPAEHASQADPLELYSLAPVQTSQTV